MLLFYNLFYDYSVDAYNAGYVVVVDIISYSSYLKYSGLICKLAKEFQDIYLLILDYK